MNRKLSLVFIAVLVISLFCGLQFTHKATGFFDRIYLPEIVINADGTVTPETNMIRITGNIYTLTGNIDGYSIVIARSNIVFDGSGFSINATSGDSPGLKMSNVNGVTIRDVNIYGRYTSVQVYICSNCQFVGVNADMGLSLSDDCNSNTITKCTMQLLYIGRVFGANNNIVMRNNITKELSVSGLNNTFSKNNFLLTTNPGIYTENIWDDGSVGNYWENNSDWRFNATEIDNTGVSNTPYVIQRSDFVSRMYPNVTCIDNYPLLYPFDIERNAVYSPTPSNTQSGGDNANSEVVSFPFALAIGIIVIGIVVTVALPLLLLIRHRKTSKSTNVNTA